METTYLYSKNNKNIYENILDEVASKNCRHTSLIIANKDVQKSNSKFMDKHLLECGDCQNALRKWEERLGHIREEIPYKKLDKKDIKLMNAECFQIVQHSKELRKLISTKKKSNSFLYLDTVSRDILKSFMSKTMVKGLVYSGLTGLFIYLLI